MSVNLLIADRSCHRYFSEIFSFHNIGNMDFYLWYGNTCQCVADGIAVVRISAGIDDNALCLIKICFLDFINNRTLVIALEHADCSMTVQSLLCDHI